MKIRTEISEYHLHPEAPTRRQFDFFDLADYMEKNMEHGSKPHSHSFYQLVWFHSNEGKHFVDFKSFDIKKDRIFFIAKNQVHYFEKRTDYQGILFHFNESFLLQNEKDIDFFINYDLFQNLETPYFQIPQALIKEFNMYADQIIHEIDNVDAFGHRAILINTLKSLLITVEREKRKVSGRDTYDTQVLPFLQFRHLLESVYRENWSVSQYAEKLNISTKTLNSLVKSQTGKTTSNMIKDRIVLEAKRRLCHSGSFVNEIGHDLGFQDPSYFIKFFKKYVNLTPTEFRNSVS